MSFKRIFNRLRLGGALNKPGLGGETYLTRAVKEGGIESVREFLDLGADPDAKNKAGEVPLHIAMLAQNLSVFHLLLETGANIFNKQEGMTVRERAEKEGLRSLARVLRELEVKKQEAIIAAASMAPMGGCGIAIVTPEPMRNVVLRDHLKGYEDVPPLELPPTGAKPKKPGTQSKGPQ